MTGAPRSAYQAGEFIAVRREAVEALGSWEAAGVWHRICWRAEATGTWVATIGEVAADVMLTEHKVRQALRVIREAGWVTAQRARPADRTLAWQPVWQAQTAAEPSVDIPRYVASDSPATPCSQTIRPPLPPTGGCEDEGLFDTADAAGPPPQQPSAPRDLLRGFEEWYRLWPHKKARGDAEKAWRQAVRAGADPAAIMAGLWRQAEALRDARARGFCPYPASWLRARRWEDEADAAPPRSQAAVIASYAAGPDAEWEATLPPPPKRDLYG